MSGTDPGQPDRPGLSGAEAARRLRDGGPNVITPPARPRHVRRFLAQFTHLFALLLWGGAALSWIGGTPQLAAAIVAVIGVNAVFAFVQEFRAERATEALEKLLPAKARVRRDGAVTEISAEDVVTGDVLVLRAGDRVPADAEIVARSSLRVDESTLTGESRAIEPETAVHAGTFVTAGTAEAVVTETGMATAFGRVAALTQQVRHERSPLERELDHVSRFVALLSVGFGAAFFVVAGLLGMGVNERFVFAIGVMVSTVPEGLLPTVTLSLALATQRMARRNALVRTLSSVETLGETTVICTDKTGTLTENQMTVQRVWTVGGELTVEGTGYTPVGRFLDPTGHPVDPRTIEPLLRAGLLCNDSALVPGPTGWTVSGDPTEGALVVLAAKGGLVHQQEAARYPRVAEIPFDSVRKRMSTVHLDGERRLVAVKGAVGEIVPRSTLAAADGARVIAAAERMERDALRVLAIAQRQVDPATGIADDTVERDLELLGLVGMLDPPRPQVPDAIARCRRAGIRVLMVTGDSGLTAEAIARRIGLVVDHAHVVSGPEVAALDDAGLAKAMAEDHVIFARVDPEEKLRIARLLRAGGEVVAMTGDGVNDAPALKEADIGIAMGRRGTDVAQQAAGMVLLDDDFSTIVAAVEEGRAVFDNIRRFTGYHFASNVAELVTFLAWGVSLGAVPLPLTVMQVLAIDLGTDMLPAIALGVERPEHGVMDRRPRRRSDRLLDRHLLARVYGLIGPVEGLAGLSCFTFSLVLSGWRPWQPLPDEGAVYVQATAMTVAGIVAGQIGAGLAFRSSRESILRLGPFGNRLLLGAMAVEVLLLAGLTWVPGVRDAFHMAPLGVWHWLFLLPWPFGVLGAEEARKAIVRRRAPLDP